jgi:hypothetical protein
MGNPLARICIGTGEQPKVWLRWCGTAGKPGGKQRRQTSAYSHGRPRSTRPEDFEKLVESKGFSIIGRWGGYEKEPYGKGNELVIQFKDLV